MGFRSPFQVLQDYSRKRVERAHILRAFQLMPPGASVKIELTRGDPVAAIALMEVVKSHPALMQVVHHGDFVVLTKPANFDVSAETEHFLRRKHVIQDAKLYSESFKGALPDPDMDR